MIDGPIRGPWERPPFREGEEVELFLQGDFKQIRAKLGHVNHPDDMHFFLNRIQSLWGEYRDEVHPIDKETNEFARAFLESEVGSHRYYATLFSIAREAGFEFKDRAAVEIYLRETYVGNQDPHGDNALLEAHMENAAKATKVIFAAFGRPIPDRDEEKK